MTKKKTFSNLEKVVDLGVPVSVDSNKYEIMEESIKIGSSILNDINGFESDEKIELVKNNMFLLASCKKRYSS